MDPIEFELFKNAIFSIADEMALTVFRPPCDSTSPR
jgi:N-methylhydantoinase B